MKHAIAMGFKNINLSSSPLLDMDSLCPITPFSNKEYDMEEDVFYSLATGCDKLMKKSETRKLIFNSDVKERVSEIVDAADLLMTPPSAPRLSWIAETCPGAPITKLRKRKLYFNSCVKEGVSEIVDAADVLMTPPSVSRLSWIAETCPGAPITKLKKRKLNFNSCVKEGVLEIVDAADVLMTPPSASRLNWIAKTCHGAPITELRKMKLNFNSCVKRVFQKSWMLLMYS
nr:hypothetical protein [Tanacetum cinerariifolium]